MSRKLIAQLVLSLKDQLSADAKKAANALDGVNASANRLSSTRGAEGLAKGLDAATHSAREMARVLANADMGGKFTAQLEKLKVAPREFDRIRQSWRQLQAELANPIGGRKGALVLGVESKWRNQQLSELIAVRAAEQAHREKAESISGIARRAGRGALAAGGIYGGAYAINRAGRATAIAGATDQRETFRAKLSGMTPEEEAITAAKADILTKKYPSVSRTDIRELGRGVRNLTGSTEKGMALLPDVVRARVAIQSATGGSGDGELDQLLKSADIAGLQDDPKRFTSFLESFTKAVQVEGKQISASDYLSFYRRAKMAGSGFSDGFIAAAAPSLIQELGGPTAGTALMTFFQQMAGGKAKKETLAAQSEVGLRGEDGVLKDREAFISNPFEWVQKHLVPVMEKAKVDQTSPSAMINFLLPLFSERNAAEIASKFILQREQIQRNERLYGGAKGLAAAEEARTSDPFVAASGSVNALTNAAGALADPVIPAVTSGLNTFADMLNGVAEKLRKDPELGKQASTVATSAAVGGGIVGSIRAAAALWQGGGIGGAIAQGLRGGIRGGLIGGIGSAALMPLMALRDAGEAKRPVTPTAQRMGQEIDPADWERSRRVADEFQRDPEGFRGRAMAARDALSAGTESATETAASSAAQAAGTGGAIAGQTLTQAIASGIAANAGLVQEQASSLMTQIRSLFAGGVNVPVNLSSEGSRVFKQVTGEGTAPARASGGTAMAGSLYRVNEFGEEFFQPAVNGDIVNGRGGRAGGAGAVGGSVHAPVSLSFSVQGGDASEIAQTVMAELERSFKDILRGSHSDYGLETA